MTDRDTPTPDVRSRLDVRDPESAACLLMLTVVLFTQDDMRRIPLWPEAWGLAPSLGSVLLLLALALCIHRIGRYAADAASNIRDAL